MSVAASPAKIKAYLGVVKESVIDRQDGGEEDIDLLLTCYRTLLCLELLQRGVIVDHNNSKNEILPIITSTAGRQLLRIDDTTIPKQLLAGSAVVAGRIVEQTCHVFQRLFSQSTIQKDVKNPFADCFPMKEFQCTMERCTAVEDVRLVSILKLALLHSSDLDQPLSNHKGNNNVVINPKNFLQIVIPYRLLCLAEGYYLRAASFQPDAPPMWKKVWDVIEKRQQFIHHYYYDNTSNDESKTTTRPTKLNTPWMAATSILNLIRIAQTKENTKRVSELLLRLIESYLDTIDQLDDFASNSIRNTIEDQDMMRSYLSEYRSIQPSNDRIISTKNAIESLQQLDANIINHQSTKSNTSDDNNVETLLSLEDLLFYRILHVRVHLVQENTTIQTNAEYEWQKASNRATDTTSTKKSTKVIAAPAKTAPASTNNNSKNSIEPYIRECRQQYLASNYIDTSSNPLDGAASKLRDRLLKNDDIIVSNDPSIQAMYVQGFELITQYVLRLKEQAAAVSTKSTTSSTENANTKEHCDGWFHLISFTIPIVESFQKRFITMMAAASVEMDQFISSLRPFESQLLEACVVEIISATWMNLSHDDNDSIDNNNRWMDDGSILIFINRLLNEFVIQRRKEDEQKKVDQSTSNIVTSSLNTEGGGSRIQLRLDSALASSKVFLALQNLDPLDVTNDNNTIRSVTETALQRSERWNSMHENLAGEIGFPFLELGICWSGLHRSPWPFCTLPEARTICSKARICLEASIKTWGRRRSHIETAIITLAEADAEGGYFEGGLATLSIDKYNQVMKIATAQIPDRNLRDFLLARCCNGLSKLVNKNRGSITLINVRDDDDARKSLHLLQSIDIEQCHRPLMLWNSTDVFVASIRFQISVARQLISEELLHSGKAGEARSFLEDAVNDAPTDANLAFSLGSLLLYLLFFGDEHITPERSKEAQVQLLKSAKLDSTQASPFALLGYWYEYHNDLKRAVGCYSKALLLEPTHPVAGRGVLRLASRESLETTLEKAINTTSAVTGWAWRATGQQKCSMDGNDELGAIALLKALRCRDIERQDAESLAAFYSNPKTPMLPGSHEVASILAEIASCYHRLGRFTAALRSFHQAIQESGDAVTSFLLCQSAQVEMEVGLYDDAAEKFDHAIRIGGEAVLDAASYGHSVALLEVAKRDLSDGKVGSAYSLLHKAIIACKQIVGNRYGCMQKLHGDLYTFGASFPTDLFDQGIQSDGSNVTSESAIKSHLQFIAKGEDAYRMAEVSLGQASNNHHIEELRASLISDLATNLLLRAQILSRREGRGMHLHSSLESASLYERAESEFRRAIESNPISPPAWCGLGCAVAKRDPLLSQHAFCRSIELDKLFPDSYANLSFLCTAHQAFDASETVSDALTEVADTPMMWMNRALIIENRIALNRSDISSKIQAADAYRASLQVTRHPIAMLGLAMSCRITKDDAGFKATRRRRHVAMATESQFQLSEYLGLFGYCDVPSVVFDGVAKIESGLNTTRFDQSPSSVTDQMIGEGRDIVNEGINHLQGLNIADGRCSELKIDILQNVAQQSDLSIRSQESLNGQVSLSRSSTMELSLDRQIANDPTQGYLWIKLAKKIAMKMLSNTANNPGILRSAAMAADRGVTILLTQLSETRTSSLKHMVCPEQLSDALALRYWIARLMDDSCRVDSTSKQISPKSKALDLQRSLLINPGNTLARGMLESIQTQ